MPKYTADIQGLLQEENTTRGEFWTDRVRLIKPHSATGAWNPRLTPILALLREVLADLFEVRDQVPQMRHHRSKQARAVIRQYERDLHWLASPEEQEPFSFVWLCQALGLEASAVRRRYLSGQPVSLLRRHHVGTSATPLHVKRMPRAPRTTKPSPPSSACG